MGRPTNRRWFGGGPGEQIPAKVFIEGASEADGYIVRQRGTKKFLVNDGTNEGLCVLADTTAGSLTEGQMLVQADDGTTVRPVIRIRNRTVRMIDGGTAYINAKWNLTNSGTADVVQLLPGDVQVPVVIIDTQPTDQGSAAGAATFTITAHADPAGAVTYQWQVRHGGGSYANITDGVDGNVTHAGATTASLGLTGVTVAEDAWTYRCVCSVAGGTDVTSATAALDFVS